MQLKKSCLSMQHVHTHRFAEPFVAAPPKRLPSLLAPSVAWLDILCILTVWCTRFSESSVHLVYELLEPLSVTFLCGCMQIVRLVGANLTPPKCCIVMERCRCSLFERLHTQRDELDRRDLVSMAIQAT